MKVLPPTRSTLFEVVDSDPTAAVPIAFTAHAAGVARFVRRMGVAGGDVDDVVQDVFLAAHAAGGYRPGAASERSWVLRLAWYAVTNHRRRRARTPDAVLDEPRTDADQQRTLEARESLVRVSAALDRLSMAHRAVLVLFEIEGYAVDEISLALQIPEGTVHSRLHHARRRFADALRPPAERPRTAHAIEGASR